MIATKFILVGAIVAICLLSFDSVEGQCLNCEAPWGTYCCKTSHDGHCCEWPIPDTNVARSADQLSPLARQMKKKEESNR